MPERFLMGLEKMHSHLRLEGPKPLSSNFCADFPPKILSSSIIVHSLTHGSRDNQLRISVDYEISPYKRIRPRGTREFLHLLRTSSLF